MKCDRCGAELEDNIVKCKYCGHLLQMVPDYNPLEDVLADEVRSAIYVDSEEEVVARKKELANRRRREIERRKVLKRKRRNLVLGCIGALIVLIAFIIFLVHSNSYSGQLNKGIKAVANEEYTDAIDYFKNCISKDKTKTDAYLQLADVYIAEEDYENAEYILLQALLVNTDDIELNEKLIDVYVLMDDMSTINTFINTLDNEEVIDALSAYISLAPTFSLQEGSYEDVQELTIFSDSGSIYYTIDGSEPTEESFLFSEAILIGEGSTTIRAISINSEGVPSYETKATYEVVLPMESAPTVTPSTGQYTEETTITVQVPQGYTAYYTTDNTTPTTSSTLYTGPISMKEGNTIFSVILVSADGRYSDVTKRNYELVLPKVEESDEDTSEE